ncbi:MAG: DUF2441 domain-containing protein [Clostridia bacterium]|nr:DUF2441 domain-containing protein [Clostridia bacterium]
MNVKHEKFYHIHRTNELSHLWVVGNKINFTTRQMNVFNKYYESYYPRITIDGNVYPMSQALDIICNRKLYASESNAELIVKQMQSITKEFAIYLRENIFEEIRANYFPSLPSRKSCLWVCDKNALDYWKATLGHEHKVFEVSITGTIHRADQRFLNAEILPSEMIRENAFNYWTGCDGANPIEEEILAEGIVEIIREV